MRGSRSEACITATSSAAEPCPDPARPPGDAARCEELHACDRMADGRTQSISPRALQGLELGGAIRPGPGAAHGQPARRAAWGSAPQLAVLSGSPASPRGPAEQPEPPLPARALARQLLDGRERTSPDGVLDHGHERLTAAAGGAAAPAPAPASSAGLSANDDDLPVSGTPITRQHLVLSWRPPTGHAVPLRWRCMRCCSSPLVEST